MDNRHNTILALLSVAIVSSGITYATLSPEQNSEIADPGLITGHVTATLKDGDGNIVAYRQTDNKIVNRGLDMLANQLFGNGSTTATLANNGGTIKAMALGEGSDGVTVNDGDTDLISRVNLGSCNNRTATFSESTAVTGTDRVSMIANVTFQGSAGCNAGIDEAGLFSNIDGAKSGDMFARQAFSAVTVGTADSLTLNWDILFTRG